MALRVSNACALAMCNAATALVNTGGAGSFKIYTGTAPTNVEDAATGTLLGTLPCSATAFGAATDANPGALATAAAITSDSVADAAGTAGYFRILNGSGTAVMQGSCATSGQQLNFNSVSIAAGAIISISSFTLTHPEL